MEKSIQKFGTFRRFLAQFVATSVKNLLILDLGLGLVIPSIIIPALTGIPNQHNRNETLKLTAVQASWLGSLLFIFEPLGSIISAAVTDSLGRKRTMMLVNIPLIIAWFMVYNANSVYEIFLANILLGLSIGLMESPIITYVGEICEPSYRGILIAYTNITSTIGMSMVFILNTLMPWRTVGLVCMFVPIITVIALCFIPETPLFLLSRNRTNEAENALCWLRGWTTKEAIADEFKELQRYSQRSKSCNACIKNDENCIHPTPTMCEKLNELKRKQTLKPLFIVLALFIFAEFTGVTGMSPFIVQIFKAYGSPIEPDQAAAIVSLANNVANVVFLCTIRYPGKRIVYLVMMMGIVLCSAIISGYGFMYLPKDYNSFDQTKIVLLETKEFVYIPFVCLILWSFCTFCAVNSVPWQLLSEVFPFKARGAVAGLSAAFDYIIAFISTKTYYNFETLLSLPGISLLNCIIAVCGLILMYNILPETENHTLEAIELHFSDKTKKITDRHIANVYSKPANDHTNSANVDKLGTVIGWTNDEFINKIYYKGCANRGFVNDA